MSSGDNKEVPASDYDDSKSIQNPAQQPFEDHWQSGAKHPADPSSIHEIGVAMNEGTLGVCHSLVPDLMKVYQNMSVSKTPQTRSSAQAQNESGTVALDSGHRNEAMKVVSQPPKQYSDDNVIIPAPYPVPYAINEPIDQNNATGQMSSFYADSSSSVEQQPTTRKRSKDSGSTSSAKTKRRKKSSKDSDNDGKEQDGRWTKRFTWPEELHRDFVSAIFDIGLKHATPSSVFEQMPQHEQITTERIKSHLQKYRLHRRKSKQEFMSCYEEMLDRLKASGGRGVTSLAGGQVAGYVAHAVDTQPDPEDFSSSPEGGKQKSISSSISQMEGVQDGDTILTIPRLTEEEKQSSMGTSFGYLLGLFFSLKRQLQEHRQPRHQFPDNLNGAAAIKQGSASRSNLEAGSLMKREMESQMAFQNKMRALKQEELSKLAEVPAGTEGGQKLPGFPDASSPVHHHQRPGEAMEHHPATKTRAGSEDDEFWHSTTFDGELFDFLMD